MQREGSRPHHWPCQPPTWCTSGVSRGATYVLYIFFVNGAFYDMLLNVLLLMFLRTWYEDRHSTLLPSLFPPSFTWYFYSFLYFKLFFFVIIISSVYFSCPDCSLEIANPICLLMEYACPLLVERLITWFYFYHFKVYCLFILSFIFPFLSLCAGLTRHCYSLQLLLLYS